MNKYEDEAKSWVEDLDASAGQPARMWSGLFSTLGPFLAKKLRERDEAFAKKLEDKAAEYRDNVKTHFSHSQRKVAAERIAADLEREASVLRGK